MGEDGEAVPICWATGWEGGIMSNLRGRRGMGKHCDIWFCGDLGVASSEFVPQLGPGDPPSPPTFYSASAGFIGIHHIKMDRKARATEQNHWGQYIEPP